MHFRGLTDASVILSCNGSKASIAAEPQQNVNQPCSHQRFLEDGPTPQTTLFMSPSHRRCHTKYADHLLGWSLGSDTRSLHRPTDSFRHARPIFLHVKKGSVTVVWSPCCGGSSCGPASGRVKLRGTRGPSVERMGGKRGLGKHWASGRTTRPKHPS